LKEQEARFLAFGGKRASLYSGGRTLILHIPYRI
jgi:hypothetical protein